MAKRGEAERVEVHYQGRVQGVGFRQTVYSLAEGFDVVGLVQNLPDGRVRLVAEGTTAEVDAFLASIAQRMASHIAKSTIDRRPAVGDLDGFEIAY